MMATRSFKAVITLCAIILATATPTSAYVPYDSHVFFLETVTKDIVRLLPRAMGQYIYQNRYDFLRGMTFMTRNIQHNTLKLKDMEEIRREAYERLMRDIPYCIEAFKGGELKLDTSHNNLAARLGMIANSILLLKMPEFPDLQYLEQFSMSMDEMIVEGLIDVWLFYDGYGDFNSLGELMERLKPEGMPTLIHVRNEGYAAQMKEEIFSVFRAPDKFNRNMIFTNIDVNHIYNNQINNILDAFVYIWKCSGMDLAHPSYAAPPGTVISRPRRGATGWSAGVLSKPLPLPEEVQPPTETTLPPAAAPAPGSTETPSEGQ